VGVANDGGSLFDEIDVPLGERGELGRLCAPFPASSVIFRENDADADDDYDWHNAPQRQLIVLLDGAIEVEVTSGEKRRFGAGDALLVEDTTGTGHRTRNEGGTLRRSLFIPLADA
jgi:quercetin dioxygenase-like cupin family protein